MDLLEVTLESVGQGLVAPLLENELAEVYSNLDNLMERNEDWLYLSLHNASEQSIYPLKELSIEVTDYNYLLTYDIKVGDKKIGKLDLLFDFTDLASSIREDALNLLFLIVFMLILFYAFVAISIHFLILKPTLQMSYASDMMVQDEYNIALPSPKKDEMGLLVKSFSAMRSKLKENKDELERIATEAKEATLAKSQFLANMSHELRTPMNGVIGISKLLLDSGVNQSQKNYIQTILKSSNNLLILINDILDYSKMEVKQLQVVKEVFSIEKCIDEVYSSQKPLADEKNIVFTKSITGHDLIISEASYLQRILYNLVGNAIKFTNNGGNIWISTQIQDNGSSEGMLIISIRDTGIGFDSKAKDKIFDSFSQMDYSIKRRYGGTGLGLSITRKLIDALDGEIEVRSEVNEGSEFTIKIPVVLYTRGNLSDSVSEQKDSSINTSHPSEIFEGYRVLVVDDNEVNCFLAKELFDVLGFKKIEIASNGTQCIQAFRDDPDYDIILMDCHMPEMDGFEATEEIRKIDLNIPIVAVTADISNQTKLRCDEVGMSDYLTKPIDIDLLRNTLIRYLSIEDDNNDSKVISRKQFDKDQSPIDLELLRVISKGDAQVEKEFYDLLIKDIERGIEELNLSMESMDLSMWKDISHKMKGATANVGAVALQHTFLEAEKSKDLEQMKIALSKVQNNWDELKTFISKALQGIG